MRKVMASAIRLPSASDLRGEIVMDRAGRMADDCSDVGTGIADGGTVWGSTVWLNEIFATTLRKEERKRAVQMLCSTPAITAGSN